ncbi:MAG: OB-fold domain-containing protein, partial [Myxococcota bacterium]
MSASPPAEEILSAPHVLEYTYKRSLGPVLSRFFTGLREGRIEGVRTRAGRVLVPPTEYDPDSGEATGDFVEVGPGGVVTSWAWVFRPRPAHPLARPFAWALVQLDGADSSLVHVVDAGRESHMATGMRVRAKWR